MRTLTLLAAAFALFLTLCPSSAHAFEVCDREFRDEKALTAGLWILLQRNTPYRDSALAQKVSIQLTGDTGRFGPSITQGSTPGSHVILIPRGFIHLNCRMVMTTLTLQDHAGTAREVDACLARGASATLYRCLDSVLRQREPRAESRLAQMPIEQRMTAALHPLASIEFLLLHEFAHAALGHFDDARYGTVEDRELEFAADLYASRYQTITRGNSMGGVIHFGSLALLTDPRINAEDTHDRPFCRFENASNISATLEQIPALLLIMPVRTAFSDNVAPDLLAQRRSALHRIAGGGRFSDIPIRFSPSCRVQALPQLATLRRDLVKLVQYQDRIAASLPSQRDKAAITQILVDLALLKMESAEGRAVRLHLIAAYLLSYRDTMAEEKITGLIYEILETPAMIDDALSQAVGVLYQQFGQRLFYHPGPGGPWSDDTMRHYLYRGFVFGPYDAENHATLVRLELRKRDCGAARKWQKLGFGSENRGNFDPALSATIEREIAGKCH